MGRVGSQYSSLWRVEWAVGLGWVGFDDLVSEKWRCMSNSAAEPLRVFTRFTNQSMVKFVMYEKSFYFSNVDPALLDSRRWLQHSAYLRRITIPWGSRVSNILSSSVTAVTATFQQRLNTQLFASTPVAICFDAIHLSLGLWFCARDCVKQESLANAKVC